MTETSETRPAAVRLAVAMMATHAALCLGLGLSRLSAWDDVLFFGGVAYAVGAAGWNLRNRDPTAWWFCRLFGLGGGAINAVGTLALVAFVSFGVGGFGEGFARAPVSVSVALALWAILAAVIPLGVGLALSTRSVREWIATAPSADGALSA